jgi:hypothetical protein
MAAERLCSRLGFAKTGAAVLVLPCWRGRLECRLYTNPIGVSVRLEVPFCVADIHTNPYEIAALLVNGMRISYKGFLEMGRCINGSK